MLGTGVTCTFDWSVLPRPQCLYPFPCSPLTCSVLLGCFLCPCIVTLLPRFRSTPAEGGETVFPLSRPEVQGHEWSKCAKQGFAIKPFKVCTCGYRYGPEGDCPSGSMTIFWHCVAQQPCRVTCLALPDENLAFFKLVLREMRFCFIISSLMGRRKMPVSMEAVQLRSETSGWRRSTSASRQLCECCSSKSRSCLCIAASDGVTMQAAEG
eukprot:347241-Chlamydomonas_euryale.AAC.4